MATKTATKKTTGVVKRTTAKRASTKSKKPKKAYTDGKLEFKSQALLSYHLTLKEHKKNGLIQEFAVPTIGDKTKNKHGAMKVMVDGHLFDSAMESRYYIHLLEQKLAGEVLDFSLQPRFELQPGFKKTINGKVKTFRKIEYIADFIVVDKNNEESTIDVKGQLTDTFRLKQKMFEYVYPDRTLTLLKLVRGKWEII